MTTNNPFCFPPTDISKFLEVINLGNGAADDGEDIDLGICGEWWPKALEQAALDNADADCSPR